ncbi:MAG: glucose-6-phosphate isomerase [Candidatus Makana argininalis]
MKNVDPINTVSWKKLYNHYKFMKTINIKDLFLKDKNRFFNFSKIFKNNIFIDYSKNYITQNTLKMLINLSNECHLKESILAMFEGKYINKTENRAVLHIALRNRFNIPININCKNIMIDINLLLYRMKMFCKNVITGNWKGYTNKSITDVVNIGIGGSYLGPYMVNEALKYYKNHINIHYIANIDGTNFIKVIQNLNPETTMFLIASKTFTTEETMTNANSALCWFMSFAIKKKYIKKHFIALSSNKDLVNKFGIDTNNMFEIWNWVGGRYSIWSSIGLSIALSIGFENFEKMLNGAHDMDMHFLNTKLDKNIPVILALIGIWYNNFYNIETEAILPYDQYMHKFTAYFQQVNMESNGKYIDRNGNFLNYQTGPIIWGEPGTNGQHSFYQLIHQGTKIVPCDFIAPALSHNKISNHHEKLLSNFFAQTEALAFGNKLHNKKKKKNHKNNNQKNINLNNFKYFKGNRPSNSILLSEINPYNLGALIALYEHKIFTQGILLNIYSFDQWGVELGKKLSNNIFKKINYKNIINSNLEKFNLINFYKNFKKLL